MPNLHRFDSDLAAQGARLGQITISCVLGASAHRKVIMGFASAKLLAEMSFADVLDEKTGSGYQRRFNSQHSLDFRRYIQKAGSTTIPLTFNLRSRSDEAWSLVDRTGGLLELQVRPGVRVLSQVDCQHRLGFLSEMEIELPFMSFVGLTAREEMEVFGVINGKAKGLSRSLLDFHDAQLCEDLSEERPELVIALLLKNDPESPWYNRLDLGGNAVSGMDRRASLRTIQKAARAFLRRVRAHRSTSAEGAASIALNFWIAVNKVLPETFLNHRKYLVTKGIGVYALMEIAADMAAEEPSSRCDINFFAGRFADFAIDFDWSSNGPLKGLGGESGVKEAVDVIRGARRRRQLRLVHG